MDTFTIMSGLTVAGVSGLAIGAGARLIPMTWRSGQIVREPATREAPSKGTRIAQQKFRRRTRETSVIGLFGDVLRHVDGSYTRGYEVPLRATMLAPDEVFDDLVDGFADMLTVDLPPGTVLQFRYAVAPDPGRALAEHLRTRDYKNTHFPSSRLHDLNVDFFKAMADAAAFRHERASLFVRVPGSHTEDRSSYGFNAFITSMAKDWREHGSSHIKEILGSNWSNTRNDRVVRRIHEHEEECLRKAEKIFRLLELQCPVSLRRLERQELWRAVYKSHVMLSLIHI